MNQREAVKLSGLDLTHAALEVLARVAFKRPISQEEIDRSFDADKRGLVQTSGSEDCGGILWSRRPVVFSQPGGLWAISRALTYMNFRFLSSPQVVADRVEDIGASDLRHVKTSGLLWLFRRITMTGWSFRLLAG
jgi:hypothetical protein